MRQFAVRLFTSILLLSAVPLAGHATPAKAGLACAAWPGWEEFRKNFINEGGRVIDLGTARQHTVSEAQAYALFFALVANDRKNFDLILNWTENNLAGGDLTARLPAWQWGHKDDDSWGVLDPNPASDADLWLAYTLGQAGRLWEERRYTALSMLLARRILNEESAALPQLGLVLMPGPSGFMPSQSSWKLNASYLPLQLLHWFVEDSSDDRWDQILASSLHIILGSAPHGFAADWIIYDAAQGFVADTGQNSDGGYNAIRVYLWAGMLAEGTPGRNRLHKALAPMAQLIAQTGYPPEYVDTQSGTVRAPGPGGFSAAMLPFLASGNHSRAFKDQQLRLIALPPKPDAYYDQALRLFAEGWLEKRYRFDAHGTLQACARPGGAK